CSVCCFRAPLPSRPRSALFPYTTLCRSIRWDFPMGLSPQTYMEAAKELTVILLMCFQQLIKCFFSYFSMMYLRFAYVIWSERFIISVIRCTCKTYNCVSFIGHLPLAIFFDRSEDR